MKGELIEEDSVFLLLSRILLDNISWSARLFSFGFVRNLILEHLLIDYQVMEDADNLSS